MVITVCDHAHETCPFFPGGAKVIHVGFDDPPALARDLAVRGIDSEGQLAAFRRVRNEIKAFVEQLPGNLEENPS